MRQGLNAADVDGAAVKELDGLKIFMSCKSMTYLWACLGFAGLLVVSFLSTVSPARAEVFRYTLGNHPDGNQSPPPYGLRLDGLFGTGTSEEWLFDFENSGAGMLLDYDNRDNVTVLGDTVHIHGTAYGGVQDGDVLDPTFMGLWNVDYTYTLTSLLDEAEQDGDNLLVRSLTSSGTITPLFDASGTVGLKSVNIASGTAIDLTPKANQSGKVSLFDSTSMHRLLKSTGGDADYGLPLGTFVGRGWLTHNSCGYKNCPHISASDFIFIANPETEPTPIPEPSTLLLLGSSLSGLGLFRRRGKEAVASWKRKCC